MIVTLYGEVKLIPKTLIVIVWFVYVVEGLNVFKKDSTIMLLNRPEVNKEHLTTESASHHGLETSQKLVKFPTSTIFEIEVQF